MEIVSLMQETHTRARVRGPVSAREIIFLNCFYLFKIYNSQKLNCLIITTKDA